MLIRSINCDLNVRFENTMADSFSKYLKLFACIIAASLFLPPVYGAEKPSVHWDFNTVSERIIKDVAGSNNATVSGDLDNFIRPGLYGNAAYLNSGKNVVELNFSETLNLSEDFTMELVFMPFRVDGLNAIIWKGNRHRVPQQINYWAEISKGRFSFKYLDAQNKWVVYSTGTVIEAGQWYDIILNRKNGVFSVWINFVPKPFKCEYSGGSIPAPIVDQNKVMIGNGESVHERLYSFDGLIDEIKIYPGEVVDISQARQLDWAKRRIEYLHREIKHNAEHLSRVAGKLQSSLEQCNKIKNFKLDSEASVELNSDFRKLQNQLALMLKTSGLTNSPNNLSVDNSYVQKSGQIIESVITLESQLKKRANASVTELEQLRKQLQPDFILYNAITDKICKQLQLLTHRVDYQTYFYSNAGKDKDFLLTTMPAAKRLFRTADFFRVIGSPDTMMNLSLARNERESCQVLLLANPERDLTDVKIEAGNFKHDNGSDMIPASAIEWGWVKDITTRRPDIYVEFTGAIPDPIIEGIDSVDVRKADFTPLLFRFYADKNTRPGNYSGIIKISSQHQTATVNVKLKVYSFSLPEQIPFRVAFYFYERFYANWYGYKNLSQEQWDKIYAFLFKYRLQPSNFYAIQPCWPTQADIARYPGINFTTLKYAPNQKSWSDAEIKNIIDNYRTIIDKLKVDKFYPDNVYVKLYDELSGNLAFFDGAKQLMPRLQAAFPELKRLQSSFPYENIRPYYNVWCPLMSYFIDAENLKLLRSIQNTNGQELWWYLADGPSKPLPNFFLDYPVFDCRIVMTLSYIYKVKGIIYWSINREWSENMGAQRWPQVPWKPYITNVATKKTIYKNGMGNMIYPGPDGRIYPSLRLENLRDGIEDFMYLHLLEQKLDTMKKVAPERKNLISSAEKLLTVPPEVATTVDNYSSNPENLQNYRRKIAELLEQMN